MIKSWNFINKLFRELKEWKQEGLISPEQEKAIRLHYVGEEGAVAKTSNTSKQVAGAEKEKPEKSHKTFSFVRIVIWLAALCLAAGIILFYASNWRKMPPVVKLVQVFVLLFTVYGGAVFFLDPKRRQPLLGSVMLLLGIVAYGAGIFLVAQIYHISSHPTNGVLAWAIGALAIAIVAREKYACYLSAGIFFLWNFWEVVFFGSAGYSFILPVLVIMVFLLWINDIKGIIIAACLVCWYFFQISFYWIFNYADNGWLGCFFVVLFVVMGLCYHLLSDFLNDEKEYKLIAQLATFCAWVMWGLPFIFALKVPGIFPFSGYAMLCWGLSLLAASFLLKKSQGYFVALCVFALWFTSQICTMNLPWFYPVALLLIAYLFYREKHKGGFIFLAVVIIWSLILTSCYCAFMSFGDGTKIAILALMPIPIGTLLIYAGRFFTQKELTFGGGRVLHVAGWAIFLSTFFLFSWPFMLHDIEPVFLFQNYKVSTEYIILMMSSFVFFSLLRKKNKPIVFTIIPLVITVSMFFLPLGSTMVRMISFHLGILIVAAALLYFPRIEAENTEIEKTLGKAFFISIIVIKVLGFMLYSGIQYEFHLAYLAGAILFIIVCFLLNRLIEHFKASEGSFSQVIDALCAFCLWFSVYLSSFEVIGQCSIIEAGDVVIALSILFLTIAAILYIILLKQLQSGKLMIVLSFVVLFFSVITIIIASPKIPWELYSVIFNLLLLGISITYIYYSTVIQSKLLLNVSIVAFLVHVLTRYFDLFWDMFSGSLFFIATGFIGLFGGYFVEKYRKNLTVKIDNSSSTIEENIK